MYTYVITNIIKIYDGDTITVELDLGFGVKKVDKIRLSLIDAPEIRGEERPLGLISRDWLRERLFTALETDKEITVSTYKDLKGKYGRYIGEVFVDGISVNKEMLNEKLAVVYT